MKIQISLSSANVGVYASVHPTEESLAKLNKLFDKVSYIEPHRDDLHCTVLFSKNENRITQRPASVDRAKYAATIDRFVTWIGHNGKNYLVALLNCPALSVANSDWMNLGYTSTFQEYRPHITVKKDFEYENPKEVLDILNSAIAKKPLTLVFGAQKIEPLDD